MDVSKKPSVLVVDDSRMIKDLLRTLLSSDGYSVLGEASDGIDAVMKCLELKPNIVLLDINMDKMDGIKALEEIRKAAPSTMVLMVSGASNLAMVKDALSKGAAGFIVKPLVPASVLDKISACWKARKNK